MSKPISKTEKSPLVAETRRLDDSPTSETKSVRSSRHEHKLSGWTQSPWSMISQRMSTEEKFSFFTPIDSDNLSDKKGMYHHLWSCVGHTPGLIVETIMILFFSISFGQVFFPSEWNFPADIPRTIGIQMFFFSTMICQFVMTYMSNFDCAAGLMMVENVPFMHTLANIGSKYQDDFRDVFATVLLSFALSSVVVGLFFFLLGYFKLGNAVYFFPKHVIIGCIGGIGIFLATTSLEVASNIPWEWSREEILKYFHPEAIPLWLTSVAYEIVLQIILKATGNNLITPFYFISIPVTFYLILVILRVDLEAQWVCNWYFPAPAAATGSFLMWELLDFTRVSWLAIAEMVPTMISLAIFRYTLRPAPISCLILIFSLCYSLMHVPINIPSLSISTGKEVDMNTELLAHGVSNMFAGIFGGLQNYLCYCNS